jgi:hypothetical protein
MELPDPKMNGAKTATTNEFSTPQPIRSDPITHTEPPGIEPLLNGGNDHAAVSAEIFLSSQCED